MASRDKIELLVVDVLTRHTNYTQGLKQKWTELYGRYENELRKGSITAETEAKIRLGGAYALVENFVSKVIAQNPRFRYLARERGDSKPAEVYNDFNDYQHDVAKSQDEYEEIAKWGGICGLAGFKMGWQVEDIVRKKRGKEILGKKFSNPVLVDMAEKLNIGNDVKIDETDRIANWTIKAVRPHDLIWDVESTSWDESSVKGHRVRKTYGEMKAEGYDMRRISNVIRGQKDYWREQMSKYPIGTAQGTVLEQIPLEIAEVYVEYAEDDGTTSCYVMTLSGMAEVENVSPVSIRFEQNPFDKQFCPVWAFRPIKRPGKVEGFGVIEPVEGVLDAEEDTFNMNVEASWTDVSRPMEYVPDNVLNEAELQFKPRTLVPVKELGKSVAVMATPTPNMGAASFLLSYLERSKQNVTGITDYQTGANQFQKTQTLGEVNTKTFLSEQRLNKSLRSFETEVLEMSGKMALWLNQQYLADSPQVVYRVLGKKGAILESQIKFKDIEAVKDLAIVTGSSVYQMQQENRNKWIGLLQLTSQEALLPPGIGVPLTREYIWERIAEEGYGIKDSENLIPSIKDREEASVQQKMANLQDAKQENLDPATARVLPKDIHEVHIALHKAALQAQGHPDQNGQTIPYTPEQMVMLTSHLNAHVAASGGMMSPMNNALDQAMSQKLNSAVNPQMQPNGQQVPQVSGGNGAASPLG